MFTQANAWWAHVLLQVVLNLMIIPSNEHPLQWTTSRSVSPRRFTYRSVGLFPLELVLQPCERFPVCVGVLDITIFPSEPFFSVLACYALELSILAVECIDMMRCLCFSWGILVIDAIATIDWTGDTLYVCLHKGMSIFYFLVGLHVFWLTTDKKFRLRSLSVQR